MRSKSVCGPRSISVAVINMKHKENSSKIDRKSQVASQRSSQWMIATAIFAVHSISHGSHRDWENGKAFSSQEKAGNFAQNTGK